MLTDPPVFVFCWTVVNQEVWRILSEPWADPGCCSKRSHSNVPALLLWLPVKILNTVSNPSSDLRGPQRPSPSISGEADDTRSSQQTTPVSECWFTACSRPFNGRMGWSLEVSARPVEPTPVQVQEDDSFSEVKIKTFLSQWFCGYSLC